MGIIETWNIPAGDESRFLVHWGADAKPYQEKEVSRAIAELEP